MNLLEVCKKKKRWYLVFEFVDHTILDDLELFPNGLDYSRVRKYLFQIIKGIGFCHSHNVSMPEVLLPFCLLSLLCSHSLSKHNMSRWILAAKMLILSRALARKKCN